MQQLDLIRLARASQRQVSYWAGRGLIGHVERGSRDLVYDQADVERVKLIRSLRARHISLQKIRRMLPRIEGHSGYLVIPVHAKAKWTICPDIAEAVELGVRVADSVFIVPVGAAA